MGGWGCAGVGVGWRGMGVVMVMVGVYGLCGVVWCGVVWCGVV